MAMTPASLQNWMHSLDLPFKAKDVKTTLINKLKEAVKECECHK